MAQRFRVDWWYLRLSLVATVLFLWILSSIPLMVIFHDDYWCFFSVLLGLGITLNIFKVFGDKLVVGLFLLFVILAIPSTLFYEIYQGIALVIKKKLR